MKKLSYKSDRCCFRIAMIFFILFCLFIFSSCDGGTDSPSGESGSVELKIQWPNNMSAIKDKEINNANIESDTAEPSTPFQCPNIISTCDRSTINTVMVIIYNEQNEVISEDTFNLADGGGRISGVPAGLNNTIVVMGINDMSDPDCSILYRYKKDIDIFPGQTSNAGMIEVDKYLFVPTFSDYSDYSKNVLSWNSVQGAISYQIKIVEMNNLENILYEGRVSEARIDISDLFPPIESYGEYSWYVSAIDVYDNISAWSSVNSFKEGFDGDCLMEDGNY